jgi:hypothetical protein
MYWNPQDYVERRTYRSLKRAWIGFNIAKKEGNHDKMKYYVEGIQKFETTTSPCLSFFRYFEGK